uniref:Uncharacterized protein n=1 Tax=Anabas testudineus TaxID=64144 RepID=A0A3Q1H0E1_ANATE
MSSGKTVKLVLYEVLQFAALIIPIFVIMERFASLISDVKGHDVTTYWLVVAVSIAYVTSVTLLVWVPLKYLILKKRRLAACCFIPHHFKVADQFFLLLTSLDLFTELPVSLVLFSLICVDIIEGIRSCSLTAKFSGQLHPDEGQNGFTQSHPEARNGSASGRWQNLASSPGQSSLSSRAPSTAYLYSSPSRPQSYSGRLGFLWRRDGRSEVFVDSFMFWLDTVEMVRVAGEPPVFYSAWVFPVYILSFLSTLRIAITPHNPLLSSAGVALQDLPFFIIRVALLAVFGHVTPVLYPLKNVLVSLTFIYFTFLTKLRIFRRHTMF